MLDAFAATATATSRWGVHLAGRRFRQWIASLCKQKSLLGRINGRAGCSCEKIALRRICHATYKAKLVGVQLTVLPYKYAFLPLDRWLAAERRRLRCLESRLNGETRAVHAETCGGERSEEEDKVAQLPVPHASKDALADGAEADGIAADLEGEHEKRGECVL